MTNTPSRSADELSSLVAAIPEMLEALRLGLIMRDRQDAFVREGTPGALFAARNVEREFDKAVRAAIAKAEGRR